MHCYLNSLRGGHSRTWRPGCTIAAAERNSKTFISRQPVARTSSPIRARKGRQKAIPHAGVTLYG